MPSYDVGILSRLAASKDGYKFFEAVREFNNVGSAAMDQGIQASLDAIIGGPTPSRG